MAQKRLNKNLIVAMTLMGCALVVAASAVALSRLKLRDPEYYIELARQNEEQEQWRTAAMFYRKALLRTNDAAHLVSFGDMMLNLGEVQQALGSWEQALIQQPDLAKAHRRRLELLLEYARLGGGVATWNRVHDAAEAFLNAAFTPETHDEAFARHANGLALIGLSRQEADNTTRGEAELRRAAELAPDVVDYALDVAAQDVRRGRIEPAERLYGELLQRFPEPGPNGAACRTAYARFLASQGRLDEARTVIDQAVGLAVGHGEALEEARLALASLLVQQMQRAAAAPKDEAPAADRQPVSKAADRPKVESPVGTSQPAGASANVGSISVTDDAAATPEAAGATPNVGNLVVEPGAAVETAAVENPEPASPAQPAEPVQQAGAILRECIADHAEGYEAYVQLASLLLQTGSFAQAVDVCEERLQLGLSRKGVRALRNRLKTFTLMILASQACLSEAAGARQAGDETGYERWMKRADQYVEDARGEFPSHPRLFHQLGRIKLARGLDRAALDDFRTADEAYRSNDTIDWNNKLTLARVHLQLKEAGAARAVLEEVQEEARSFPGNAVYWLLYAKALLLSNEADRALVIADQLLQANPTSPDVRRLKAAILERQGRSQEAGELIEAVSGDRVARAMLTARARALSGDDAAAMTILREALVRDPDDARLVSATARELFRLDRPDEAREVVTAALAAAPDDVSLQTLSVLARADLSPEARDSAILEIITAEPDAYQRALELIHFHGSRNDNDKVLAAVQRALHHLDAGDTPSARLATIGHRRALLRIQLQVGAVLDREDVMAAARDQAQRYDVDGAGGKSLLGYYHMLRREFDLAARALRLAIEAQPTDAGSLTLLGQCLQETGDPEDADAYYVRAIEVNANEALAHRGRAVLARLRGDDETFERSFEMCRQLLPGDPWVQAEISHRREQADPHAAIARREALLEKDPEDVTNLKRLASLSETVGDTDAADEYCRRLLVLRPDDPALVLAVSRYYRRTDRPHMALTFLTTYADALPSPKEKANAHVLLASHHLAQHDARSAERVLLEGAAIQDTLELQQALAEFYLRTTSQPDKALPWLDKAVRSARSDGSPRLPRLLAARVACLLHRDINDLPEARRGVDELRAAAPDDPKGWILSAEVNARTGKIRQALDDLSEYLRQRPGDAYALYQRALHRRSLGRFAEAVDDLEAIKRTHPLALNLEPRRTLAGLYRQAGREDDWIRELQSMVAEAPGSRESLQSLLDAYLSLDRLEEARRLVTVRANNLDGAAAAGWMLVRSRIAARMGEAESAVADVRNAADLLDQSEQSVGMVLASFADLGRPDEGIAYYNRYLTSASNPQDPTTKTPASVSPWLVARHARLLAGTSDAVRAVAEFRRAMAAALADSVGTMDVVLGELRTAFAEPDAIERAISLFTADVPTRDIAYANSRLLLELEQLADRREEALRRLDALLTQCDDGARRARLLREKGDLLQLDGNNDRARRAYEESLNYDPDAWVALNNIAYLLSTKLADSDAAVGYALRAAAITPNGATLDTLGWAYVGAAQYAPAIAALSRCLRFDPDSAATFYHLGEAYRRKRDFADAARILQAVRRLAQGADDAEWVALADAAIAKAEGQDATP